MALLAGPWWRNGREEGLRWVQTERGRIRDHGPGDKPGATRVTFLDGLHNYHTHVGDAFLRGHRLPRSLPALVKPGTGYKHRMLAKASAATVANGIRNVLQAYVASGTRSLLDFREQGMAGLRMAHDALRRNPPGGLTARFLGRPTRTKDPDAELGQILEAGDGIGLPSIHETPPEALEAVIRHCRRARKPLAVHVSEQRREDIDDVLVHQPDLLIHLCAATPADVRRVAHEDVPVAVCPTSNAYFRLPSPVAALHRAGVRFHFGTDNAMLGGTDLIAEARRARRSAPRVPDAALLAALTTPPEKAIKRIRADDEPAGGPRRVVALKGRRTRVAWSADPIVLEP